MRLINKSYKSYNKVSRYNSVPYYYDTVNNKYVYGTSSYLNDTTPYTIHVVEKNETYDSLSLKYYSNSTYYWMICSFNRIQDPYVPPVEGTRLKIPSMGELRYDSDI